MPGNPEKSQTCVRKNSLGECIEWKEVGGMITPVFKDDAKECNPELYAKWKKAVKNKEIAVLPSSVADDDKG